MGCLADVVDMLIVLSTVTNKLFADVVTATVASATLTAPIFFRPEFYANACFSLVMVEMRQECTCIQPIVYGRIFSRFDTIHERDGHSLTQLATARRHRSRGKKMGCMKTVGGLVRHCLNLRTLHEPIDDWRGCWCFRLVLKLNNCAGN